jgi:tol-pal system protein YbgF
MRRTLISLTAIGTVFFANPVFAQDTMMQNTSITEERLNALESALEQLTGDFEQQKFLMQQLNKKVESLEKQKLSAVAPQPTPAPVDAQPAATDTLTPLPSDAPADAAQTGELTSGTAQDAYNTAFAKLKRADYKGAAADFSAFLKKYPDNALAGNAQYWLGETYYVRKDFNNAAAEFLKGYKKFPKNTKAPDTLLKLGMSLNALGNKEQACKAFARLPSDYPTAAPALKTRAEQEKAKLACQ